MDASVPHTHVQEHASTAAEALMELGFRSTSSEEIDDDSERTVERAVAEPESGNDGDERADLRANEADGTRTVEPIAGGGTEAVTPRSAEQDEKHHGQDANLDRSAADESQEGVEAAVLLEGGEGERNEFDAEQGDVDKDLQASNVAEEDGENNPGRDREGGNVKVGGEENFGNVAATGEKQRGTKALSVPEKASPVRGRSDSSLRRAQEHHVATRSSNSPLTPGGAQTPQTAEVKSVQTPSTQPPQHAQSGLTTVPGVPIQPAPIHFKSPLPLCVCLPVQFPRAPLLPASDGALVSLVPAASEDGQFQWIQPPQFVAAPQFMAAPQFVGGAQLMGGAQILGAPGHGGGLMPAGPVSFFRTSSFTTPVSATGIEGTFVGNDGVNATARGVSGDLFGGNAGDEMIEGSLDDLIICTPTGGFPSGFHGQMGWGGERTSRAGRRTQLWEGDPQLVYRLQQSYHTDDSAAADTKLDPATIAITGAENALIRNDSIRGDGGEEEALPAETRGNQEASTPPGMGPESRDVAQSTATMESYRGAMASGQLPLHVKVEFPTPSPRGGLPSPGRGGLASSSPSNRGGLGFSYHSPIPLCSPSPLRLCAMELGDMAEPNLWLSPPASTKYTLDKLGDFPPFSPRLPAIVRGYSGEFSAALPYLDPSAHQQPSMMSPSKGKPPGSAPPESAPPQAPGGPTADSAENPPVSASAMGSAAPQSGSPREARRGTAEDEGDAAREDGQAARREDEAIDSAGARRESGAAGSARLVSSGSPGSGVRYGGMRGRSLLQQCLIMGVEQRASRAVTVAGAGAAAGAGSSAAAAGGAGGSAAAGAGGDNASGLDRDVETNETDDQAEKTDKNDRSEKNEKSGREVHDRAAGWSPSVLKWRAVGWDGRRLGEQRDVRAQQERSALGAAVSNSTHASTPPLSPPQGPRGESASAAGASGVRAHGEGETNVGGGTDCLSTEMGGQQSQQHVGGISGEQFCRESDSAKHGENLSRANVTSGGRSFVVGSLGSTLTERVSVLELENKQTTRAGNSEDGATNTANSDGPNSSGNSRSSSNLDSRSADSNDEDDGEDGSGVVEKEEGAREEDGGESSLSGKAAAANSAKGGDDRRDANLGDGGDGSNGDDRARLTADEGDQALESPADEPPSVLPAGAERRRAERTGAEREGAEGRCAESSPNKGSAGLVRPQPRRARSGDHAISPSFSIPVSPVFGSPSIPASPVPKVSRWGAPERNAPQSAGEGRAAAQAPALQPAANVRLVQAAAQSHSEKHHEHGEAGGRVFESTSQLSGGSEGGGRGAREGAVTSSQPTAASAPTGSISGVQVTPPGAVQGGGAVQSGAAGEAWKQRQLQAHELRRQRQQQAVAGLETGMEASGHPADVMEGRDQEDDVMDMQIELDGLGDEGMCAMGEGGTCGIGGGGGDGGVALVGGGEEVKEAVSVAGVGGGAEVERDPPVKSRLTKRWEASLWTNKKQLYLGGYDAEEKAARAYDIAALACKGAEAITNFPRESYADSIGEYLGISCEALIAKLRRESSAFSRGRSKFRGVSGQEGRWEARIGSYFGRRNVSLGVYETEEAAAEQYDRALIIQKGTRAKTNFCISKYIAEHLQHKGTWAKTNLYISNHIAGHLQHVSMHV
ncbi:unnamed protein product [Closterium sp. Yama58-4]|nr:unnamed protein product [Closterium sp. Yama58-4]